MATINVAGIDYEIQTYEVEAIKTGLIAAASGVGGFLEIPAVRKHDRTSQWILWTPGVPVTINE